MGRAPTPRAPLAVLSALAALACQGVPMSQEALREAVVSRPQSVSAKPPRTPEQEARLDRARRDHFVRARLEHARIFREQGDLGASERALR